MNSEAVIESFPTILNTLQTREFACLTAKYLPSHTKITVCGRFLPLLGTSLARPRILVELIFPIPMIYNTYTLLKKQIQKAQMPFFCPMLHEPPRARESYCLPNSNCTATELPGISHAPIPTSKFLSCSFPLVSFLSVPLLLLGLWGQPAVLKAIM